MKIEESKLSERHIKLPEAAQAALSGYLLGNSIENITEEKYFLAFILFIIGALNTIVDMSPSTFDKMTGPLVSLDVWDKVGLTEENLKRINETIKNFNWRRLAFIALPIILLLSCCYISAPPIYTAANCYTPEIGDLYIDEGPDENDYVCSLLIFHLLSDAGIHAEFIIRNKDEIAKISVNGGVRISPPDFGPWGLDIEKYFQP